MTQANNCPFCGAPLQDNPGSSCPSCGAALPVGSKSQPTILSSKSSFNNSAQAMDEVKKLISEGDPGAASEIVSSEFGLSQEAAQSTVEQTGLEMQYSRNDKPPVEPAPSFSSGTVIDAPGYEEPKKPSNTRKWIIGGVIGAVIFLCLCCCLPLIVSMFMLSRGK